MHDGAIMIGADNVFLVAQNQGFVITQTQSGATVLSTTSRESDAFKFKFNELDKGRFIYDRSRLQRDGNSPLQYVSSGGSAGWELVL